MCHFFSALGLRNGDILSHPMLDSHTDLITYFQLPDVQSYHQHFAKVELTPVDWMDPSTWLFHLDEETAPSWWSDVATGIEINMRRRVAAMIWRAGIHQVIVDGCWIIGGTAEVRDVRAGRLLRIQDAAQIHDVGGSAQIHDVGGSAQIHGVWDSAQIHNVGDSAQIHGVWGSAQIRSVGGSAQIHGVRGSARLDETATAHVIR